MKKYLGTVIACSMLSRRVARFNLEDRLFENFVIFCIENQRVCEKHLSASSDTHVRFSKRDR
jgi:hypothetical protein